MASRGRGRGRRSMPFSSAEAVGITRAEGLPPSIQQPTPLFPTMEQKPLPLTGGEEVEYLLALKQEFRGAMKTLPCFIQPAAPRKDVERYSDKYHSSSEQVGGATNWTLDWRRLPRELRVVAKRPAAQRTTAAIGQSERAEAKEKAKKKKKVSEKQEVLLKLETLEKQEERDGEGEEEEEEEEEGEEKRRKKTQQQQQQQQEEEAEAEEDYDEEFEEETDYVMSYFDNGEEFGGDSDDNMDEAIY